MTTASGLPFSGLSVKTSTCWNGNLLIAFASPAKLLRSSGLPLRLLQGGAQRFEPSFELRDRQQPEAEAEDARLLAEPRAVADARIESFQRRMEAGDAGMIEL